jgi:hypothetical protein
MQRLFEQDMAERGAAGASVSERVGGQLRGEREHTGV